MVDTTLCYIIKSRHLMPQISKLQPQDDCKGGFSCVACVLGITMLLSLITMLHTGNASHEIPHWSPYHAEDWLLADLALVKRELQEPYILFLGR